MEELDKALAKITTAMTEMAQTHGAEAVDLTLEVARYHAISGLVSDFVLAVVFAFVCKIFYSHSKALNYDSFYSEMVAPALSFISGAVAVVAGVSLTLVYRWVGIFEPKIYLAYKLLDKVI